MKKIILCIVFAIFTVLLLTGCGEKNDKDAPKVVSFGGGINVYNTTPNYIFTEQELKTNQFVMTLDFEESNQYTIERLYFTTDPERMCYILGDPTTYIGQSEGIETNITNNSYFLWMHFKWTSLYNPNTIKLVGVDYRVGDQLKEARHYDEQITFTRSEYEYA